MVGATAKPASSSWESLRAKAKGLKAQLDSKMLEFGRLAGDMDKASASASKPAVTAPTMTKVTALRDDIESCLEDFKGSSDALGRLAASGPQEAQVAHFRDSHQELKRDFKRVAQSVEQQQQRARLLPGRVGRHDASKDGDEANLMRERSALDATLSMTDEVLSQAQATHDRLISQRGTLGGVSGKVGALTAMFPSLGSLIGDISDRKKKEQLVLAFTVACCMFFTMWYKFL